MNYSWFVQRNGEEEGPVPAARLAELARDGGVLPHDYVRRSDMDKWVPAGKVKGLQFRSTASNLNPSTAAEIIDRLITSDARRVELLSNGTWRFSVEETSVARTEPPPPSRSLSNFRGFHFRKTHWGMSEREVRDSESQDPEYEAAGALGYDSSIAGLPCRIFYVFVDHQLVRGRYFFSQTHSNDNHHITDYMSLKQLLTEKYGLPLTRDARRGDQIWLNDLYEDDTDNWGTAVGAGHLVFVSEWEPDETRISLCLSGDNYEVQLGVDYIGKAFEHLEDQAKQQKHLEDL